MGEHKKHIDMGVSENSGFSPQIIHFDRVFHCKPSILGYPYFWKHPYNFSSQFEIMCIVAYISTESSLEGGSSRTSSASSIVAAVAVEVAVAVPIVVVVVVVVVVVHWCE